MARTLTGGGGRGARSSQPWVLVMGNRGLG